MKTLILPSWRLLCILSTVLLLGVLQIPTQLHAQSAGISSPAPGSAVGGAVSITGTAVIESFQRYELYYKQEPSGDESYIYFDGGTRQVTGGPLGVWQTSDLAPGTYTLRMRVVKADGNYSEHYVPNLSVNQEPPTPVVEEEEGIDEEAMPMPSIDESGPTPTPIPIHTPTPVPQPTPAIVQVEQPNLGEAPSPDPTPTEALVALGGSNQTGSGEGGDSPPARQPAANPAAVAVAETMGTNFTTELGEALALDRLREHFFTGVRYSVGIFLLVLGIFVGKRLLEWTLSRAG